MPKDPVFFQKRVLVTFWFIEWVLECIVIGVSSFTFFWADKSDMWSPYMIDVWYPNGQTAAGLTLTCMAVFILLRIGPATRFCLKRLSPVRNLVYELPQFIFWPMVYFWSLYEFQFINETMPMFAMGGLLEAAYIGSFIYSCVMVHRQRISKTRSSTSTEIVEPMAREMEESITVREHSVSRRHEVREVEPILPTYEEAQEDYSPTYVSRPHFTKSKSSQTDDVKVGYGYN